MTDELAGIDLRDGDVVVRAVAPQVRLGSEDVFLGDGSAPAKFEQIPEGAVAALVQCSTDVMRYRKGGDYDPPETARGIVIDPKQLFPVNGQLEDARFILGNDDDVEEGSNPGPDTPTTPAATFTEGPRFTVEYYGASG